MDKEKERERWIKSKKDRKRERQREKKSQREKKIKRQREGDQGRCNYVHDA